MIYEKISNFVNSAIVLILAYIDSTYMFLIALFLAFFMNILAGLVADDVKFRLTRLINFKGGKFKDSLKELALIVFVIYILKIIADLMQQADISAYVVEVLVWIAIFFYVTNSLRNLTKAYPNVKWIKAIFYLVTFQFQAKAPESVKKAIEEAEKTHKKKKNNKDE